MILRRCITTVVVTTVAVLLTSPSLAREKTDLVYLKNGDRLTGEIKQLDRGILQLKTDGLSTVSIEWADIDSVNSVYHFRVEDRAGQKFFGSVFLRHDGIMEVIGQGKLSTMHADSVVSMMQLDASFWEQLDGSVSLGLSYTKAQDQSTLSFNAWVQRRSTLRKTRLDASTTVTNTESAEQSVRHNYSLSQQRLLKQIYFAEASATLQRNDELGLDLRTAVTAAGGANVFQSNRNLLVTSLGVSVNEEWASDGTQTTNVEGVLAIQHAIFTYNFPKTDYSAAAAFYPSLSDWGRVRLDIDLNARREIVSNFYLELTFYESYDNRPPGGGDTTDYGLTFGVSWTF